MIRLCVNIDHVATLRNARGTKYPDPVLAAHLCELAGADGITCHLREDRRHIMDDDLVRLRASVGTHLNLEMAATAEMNAIAERVRPDAVTLVPERREERTTEGGLDVVRARALVEETATICRRAGIKLSVFIAPDRAQVLASREAGAEQVELHTGEYCDARTPAERHRELGRLAEAAIHAHQVGLEVAAGHGLNRHNLVRVAALPEVVELNIGHAIVAEAVLVGMGPAVAAFRAAVERGVRRRAR
jgi:pyridoxine 5-phosphate synthase